MMSVTAMADYYVAKIGATRYTSLKAAVDSASNGDTIKMIANHTTKDHIQIKENVNITLDLNGDTIDYQPNSSGKTASPLINVLYNGTLTIIDSSKEKGVITCKSNNNGKTFNLIQVQGVCTINGGTYSYNQSKKGCTVINVINISNKIGTLTINKGVFSTSYGGQGGTIRNEGNTTINGGTIINNYDVTTKSFTSLGLNGQLPIATAVYNLQESSTISINGGTITSNQYAVWVAYGTANLSSSAIYNGLINDGNDSTFILSDNADFKDIDSNVLASAKTITYSRNTNGIWGTVCLPFAPDKNDNVKYYSINKIDANTKTLDVTEVSQPEADTPYLFMLNSGNVFQATGSNTITKSDTAKFVSNQSGAMLKGVFEKTSVFASQTELDTSTTTYNKVVDENSYYISKDNIYHINRYFNLKPYRAYFVLPNKATPSNSYQVAILDELTGLGSTEKAEKSKEIIGIYSLSGQKQSYLQKGINIVRYSDGTSQTINVSSR